MTTTHRLLVASFLATVGCAPKGEPRVAVSGRVTYHGQPVSGAAIVFLPDIDKEGLGANGAVTNGHYAIPAESGPSAGEFSVLIMDGRPDAEKEKSPKSPVPARYREVSELHVTIPRNKSISFDFDLIDEPDTPVPGLKPPG